MQTNGETRCPTFSILGEIKTILIEPRVLSTGHSKQFQRYQKSNHMYNHSFKKKQTKKFQSAQSAVCVLSWSLKMSQQTNGQGEV